MNFLVLLQESSKNPSKKECLQATQASGIQRFPNLPVVLYECSYFLYFSIAQETQEKQVPCLIHVLCKDKTQAWVAKYLITYINDLTACV